MWNYIQPVEIVFEWGGIQKLKEIILEKGYERGVLICDPYFASMGMAEQLKVQTEGKLVAIFSEITPNPKCEEVEHCIELMKSVKADFAVALGGGSAMDCGKAACAVVASGGTCVSYHSEGAKLSNEALPLICIPTTSGTGSEVTCVSVLTDEQKNLKAPLSHPSMYPKMALIDPSLTVSMPKQVTASCGLDVLSHALEAFWSLNHQPICDALALRAARLVFEWLPVAYANGENQEARSKMSEASVIGGLAFALPKTAASHACSFPLTQVYGIPHGEACAFTLDLLCTINAAAENGRLNEFAKKLGFKDATEMGQRITEMKKEMGMKMTLEDAGIQKDEISALAQMCQHPNLKNNPVTLDQTAVEKIFLSLC